MAINFFDLQYFLEVAHAENLSRAADRLGIRQPSLTLAIQRLESEMGTFLLIRSPKGVQLTRAGRQLQLQARRLLQNWEELRSAVKGAHEEARGVLSVGVHPSVALYSMGLILPQVIKKNPNIEIKLVHNLSRRINEAIVQFEIDVGLVINATRHPDLVVKTLTTDEVTFWTSTKKGETPADVLICDPDLGQTQSLIGKWNRAENPFARTIHTSNLEVVAELTASGCGIGILPGRVAEHWSQKLQRVPSAPVFKDELCLVYRSENKSVRAIQVFTQQCLEVFSEK